MLTPFTHCSRLRIIWFVVCPCNVFVILAAPFPIIAIPFFFDSEDINLLIFLFSLP